MDLSEISGKYLMPAIEKSKGKIKAVWIYGSSARGEAKKGSDIDVMVILDDVEKKITAKDADDVMAEFRKFSEQAKKDGWILHFQRPRTLTAWWDLLRSGEPWALTGMKDCYVVYDPAGFVEPIKRLLNEGRMSATRERAMELMKRVYSRKEELNRIRDEIASEILLAMVESAQAVLMYMGRPPASPDSISRELKKLAKKGMIDEKYHLYYATFYKMCKSSERSGRPIELEELEEQMEKAKEFLKAMEELFSKLEKEKQETIIEESFEAAKKSLKKVARKFKLRGNEKEIVENIRKLVEEGKLSKYYLDLLEFILDTANKFRRGGKGLTEKEIYSTRLYASALEDYAEAV